MKRSKILRIKRISQTFIKFLSTLTEKLARIILIYNYILIILFAASQLHGPVWWVVVLQKY